MTYPILFVDTTKQILGKHELKGCIVAKKPSFAKKLLKVGSRGINYGMRRLGCLFVCLCFMVYHPL